MSDPSSYPENLPDVSFRQQSTAVGPSGSKLASYPLAESMRFGGGEDLNIRALWRIIRKRRWLVAGIVFIVTTLVVIDVFRTRPLYQATATIEIGRDNGTRLSSNEVFIRENDDLLILMNTSEVILKSPPLLEDVVADLQLDENPAFYGATGKSSVWASINEIAAESSRKSGRRSRASSPRRR